MCACVYAHKYIKVILRYLLISEEPGFCSQEPTWKLESVFFIWSGNAPEVRQNTTYKQYTSFSHKCILASSGNATGLCRETVLWIHYFLSHLAFSVSASLCFNILGSSLTPFPWIHYHPHMQFYFTWSPWKIRAQQLAVASTSKPTSWL